MNDKKMLNFIVHYDSILQDLICSKLTTFWHKVILGSQCRIIQLFPQDKTPYDIDRHKRLYDETITKKFDPADQGFWLMEPIMRCLYFINASDTDTDNNNYYIGKGKIFKEIPNTPKEDIMGANGSTGDVRLIKFVNEQMNEHCGYPLLDVNELIFYDFSILHLSDKGRSYLRNELKNIYQSYPMHVDEKCFYAILSCLCAHAKNNNISSGSFGINPIDINNSKLVEDFYILL